LKFIVSLAFCPSEHLLEIARTADASGYDAVALSDHVVHPETIRTPYPYTEDGAPRWAAFTPWPDPWVTVGALSAVTERLRFLTAIYVLPMRNPFLVAKAVGTAAVLSGGRVRLGVGAGWMRDEFELLEQPFEQRGRRMDEMLELLAKLWQGGMVEHRGEFYACPRLEMSPVPPAPIPVWVGGLSAPALRRAATRADGWISDLHTTEELAGLVSRLRALRGDSERADVPLAVAAACRDAFDLDGYRRLRDLGVTHLITIPWLFHGAAPDDLPAKLSGLERFADEVLHPLEAEAAGQGARSSTLPIE
jgi:probable F420-dependent oxidoreductase